MEFDIAKRTNYLVVSGSYAYGTFSSTSDYDLRGWGMPPTGYFLTFDKHFEQSDQTFKFKEYPFAKELKQYVTKNSYRLPEQDEEIDHCIYDIRKFFALAAECNPNIIELLFVDENEVLICDDFGKQVREARDLFLSARAKHTFTGYAVSQLKRINTHRRFIMHPPKDKPTREQFGLPATGLIPAEQRGAAEALVNAQIRDWLGYDSQIDKTELSIFRENLTDFLSRILSSKDLIIQFRDEYEMIRAARLAAMEKIGMDKNYIAVLQKEKEYRDKLTEWTQYQTWVENRNPERAALEAKWGFDCYTDDTEFLTKDGWKAYDAVKKSTKLATVNPKTFRIQYQSYKERFSNLFTGNLYNLIGYHTDICVTPNHRMLIQRVETNTGKEYGWTLQQAAFLPRSYNILSCIKPKPRNFKDKKILGMSILQYMRILGWYVSEGHINKRLKNGRASTIGISQLATGKMCLQVNRRKEGLAKVGIKINTYRYFRKGRWEIIWTIPHRKLANKIDKECGNGSKNKKLPRWVFQLSKRALSTLLTSLIFGDGTKRTFNKIKYPKTYIYYTSSRQLADDVQEVAFLCGYETSIWGPYKHVSATKKECMMYQVHINKVAKIKRRLTRKSIKLIPVKNKRTVCFSVKNGILITRRNGEIAIQGNCKHGGHLVRLLLQGKELLTTGKITIKRHEVQQMMHDVKAGAWSYEKLISFMKETDNELRDLYDSKKYVVPHKPKMKELSKLCESIVRQQVAHEE